MNPDPSEPMPKIVGTGTVAAMLGVTQRTVRTEVVLRYRYPGTPHVGDDVPGASAVPDPN